MPRAGRRGRRAGDGFQSGEPATPRSRLPAPPAPPRRRPRRRARRACPAVLGTLSLCLLGCPTQEVQPSEAFERARTRAAPAEREWRRYLGDGASSQSSPLFAIDRENVSRLVPVWRYDAGALPETANPQIQFNPLVVRGVLYGGSPSLQVFALDAATGEELWRFDPGVDVELWTASRGAAYWTDGEADERLLVGAGPYVFALDARTGRPIPEFGRGGRIDLREGLDWDPEGDAMGVVATTPGVVFEDLLIQGGRVGETRGAAPGHIRAFDVRTGERRWIFHTIPRPGQPGYETWPPDAWRRVGGANSWAGFALDAERGLVFAPTGSASFDFHGGDRVGDNLFANSLIALDARTGERRWHRQIVRHDVWDRDLPAPPNLVEIERDGRLVPAVAQVTKTGHVFVLHRETGEALFPIEEVPVLGEPVPGEVLAESQPLPTAPPPFVRQEFGPEWLTDRTPEARASVADRLTGMRYGHPFLAPSPEGTVLFPGTDGGAEWGGAAWDAETGLLFVNANQVPSVLQMIAAPEELSFFASPAGGYVMLCASCHGLDLRGDGGRVPSLRGAGERLGLLETYRVIRDGRGHMPGFAGYVPWYGLAALAWYVRAADEADLPSGWAASRGGKQYVHAGYQNLTDFEQLPGSKPPWGTLTAIDLSAGEIAWQRPLGDYREVLAAGRSGLGAESYGGPIVTAGGLVFIAASPDARLRAFDKRTGALLWEGELPTAGFATPATYEADGRQLVVVAAGGGKLRAPSGSQYVAFGLPRDEGARRDESAPAGSRGGREEGDRRGD